jgi:hypothetical protein
MQFAMDFETARGRTPTDVSGEHRDYPFDIHSSGPGGPRYIEVKGTTGGTVILSDNERKAARKLGSDYYLYIVEDPMEKPRLSIVRDPATTMDYDDRILQGVSYVYRRETWQAARGEEA